MGHAKEEKIKDLFGELNEIRHLPGLQEKSLGVFYLKSKPFLHFHDKGTRRWAHVKTPQGDWQEVEIAFDAPASARSKFLKSIRSAHEALLNKGKSK